MGWLSVSAQMCFALGLWCRVYLPFINAFVCSLPHLECSLSSCGTWCFLSQQFAGRAKLNIVVPLAPYPAGFGSKKKMVKRFGLANSRHLSTASSSFGPSWLVMVENLAYSEVTEMLSLPVSFLQLSCLYVQVICSWWNWKDPEQLTIRIALQPALEVDALLYLAG